MDNPDDAYRIDLDDDSLRKPEEDKECQKNNEIAAPEVIRIQVVASLDVFFSGDDATCRTSTEQRAHLVRA